MAVKGDGKGGRWFQNDLKIFLAIPVILVKLAGYP